MIFYLCSFTLNILHSTVLTLIHPVNHNLANVTEPNGETNNKPNRQNISYAFSLRIKHFYYQEFRQIFGLFKMYTLFELMNRFMCGLNFVSIIFF